MNTMPRTLIAIQEAVGTRDAEAAFAGASEGARKLPGKKASVYIGPDRKFSYDIETKRTGGKTAPSGKRRVGGRRIGEIRTSKGSGEVELHRDPKPSRLKQQLKRIAGSSRLSKADRAEYLRAAKKKKGQEALPSGAIAGMRHGAYGVDPRRKLGAPAFAKKQPAKSRTWGALKSVGGAVKSFADRVTGRRKKRVAG